MADMALYDRQGEKIGQVEVSDDLFATPCNPDLLHQAVVLVEDQMRRSPASTLSRSEVKLTKAKWYRQKGTGRARHGAQSAPIFVGGGVAHGPRGVRRPLRMNRRMKRRALAGALTQKVHEGAVMVVDEITMDEISTKAFVAMLEDLEAEGRILMLLGPEEARDEKLYKSGRNIQQLVMREAPHINARDVIWAQTIIITQAGLQALTGRGSEDA